MAAAIPVEILEHTMSYICYEDYFACLAVCKRWYSIFCGPAYNSVTIFTQSQCKRFLKTITRAIRKQRPFIHSIQRVYLEHDGLQYVALKSEELNVLLQLKNLQKLNFSPLLWQKLDDTAIANTIRTVPHLTCHTDIRALPLLRTIGSELRELSISADIFNLLHTAHELFQFLSCMTLIESITVKSIETHQPMSHLRPWSMDDMETMHKILPRLSELDLAGVFFLTPEDGAIHRMPIARQQRMRRVRFECSLQDTQWIYYTAQKYPQLTHMALAVHRRRNASINRQTYGLFWSAILALLQACPELVSLVFNGCITYRSSPDPHPLFAYLITHNVQLQDLRFPDGIDLGALHSHEIHHRLAVLDPTLHSFSFQLAGGSIIEPIRSIAFFYPSLAVLSLSITNEVVKHGPNGILDLILKQCRRLTTLVFAILLTEPRYRVALTVHGELPTHTTLTSLEFRAAAFDGLFFNSLGRRCPSLTHLKLTQCEFRHIGTENAYQLDFYNHRFDKLVLTDIYCRGGDAYINRHISCPSILLITKNKQTGEWTKGLVNSSRRIQNTQSSMQWHKPQNQGKLKNIEVNGLVKARVRQSLHLEIRCQQIKIFEYLSTT